MCWPCPTCDRELTTERGMRQHHTKVHGTSLPNRTCRGRGDEFYDPKAQRAFCDDCNPDAGEHNGNWRNAKQTATCRLCGAEIEYYPSDKDGVYCPECVAERDEFLGDPYRLEAERIDTECRQCGTDMSVLLSDIERGRGKFCSRACLSRWMSEKVVGADHHQWKGGPIDYGGRWWAIRRKALERDDHTCQRCGIRKEELGGEPDVHHIRPVRTFDDPEDAHGLDNVVSLCRACHRRIEAGESPVPESHR